MGEAKKIHIEPISSNIGRKFIREHHYSGKVVSNSQLHLGVFWLSRLHGVMSFGPSIDKRRIQGLVKGTGWNEFIELNRMAFDDALPRNSESRAIAVAMRMLRKYAPQVKWVISFADACQCGDGAIYRASGFVLTAIKPNKDLVMVNGKIMHTLAIKTGRNKLQFYESTKGKSTVKAKPIEGFQLRYIYFIDKSKRKDLTVPILPFSAITEAGATMYKGKRPVGEKVSRSASSRE